MWLSYARAVFLCAKRRCRENTVFFLVPFQSLFISFFPCSRSRNSVPNFPEHETKQITSNSLLLITYINPVEQCTLHAYLGVRALGLQPLDCWDRGFESHWRHDFSFLVFVWCCVGSGLRDGLITIRNVTAWCRITGCFEVFCGCSLSLLPSGDLWQRSLPFKSIPVLHSLTPCWKLCTIKYKMSSRISSFSILSRVRA